MFSILKRKAATWQAAFKTMTIATRNMSESLKADIPLKEPILSVQEHGRSF